MKKQKKFKTFNNKINSWKWRNAKAIMFQLHELSYFFWECTLKCNLNCLHCGSDCTKDEKCIELQKEKVIKVFNDIANNYAPKEIMIAVTGGEPLLREDLFDILSEISKIGFQWGMVTNGMLVDEDVVIRCKELGMRTVSVSLDGLEETHNWLRNNKESYKRAICALKLFVEKGNLSIVEAITCVNKRNISQLEDIYKELENIGINRWRLISPFPLGRAESITELSVDKNLILSIFEFVISKRKNSNKIEIEYSEEGYLGCECENKIRNGNFYCGAGIHVGGLLCDGSFGACPSLHRQWNQGHVDEISFSEAWESRYRNMRNREWMKSNECKSCKEWKDCQGSSLHLWDWNNGKQKICHFKLINS